ncbi:MAG: Hsp33 family molecular chaperone HslO [Ruminococcaceae bacterium]|nr:Hsp33 family molecular chaperone HslO [Oscillospiraceae bacterium]
MNKIIRCITSDGAVMASAIDSSDIVYAAQKIHRTSNVATAALGRLLTAASMMGAQLKSKDATISLRVAGDGPLGVVIAAADSDGYVRGYVENSNCVTEHYQNGKLNVGKAVGQGVLNVMKKLPGAEPYIGQVPLVSGEIAEDITSYYATSEQLPTICALGVLVDKNTGEVLFAGGLLVQLLPGAFEDTIEKLEKNVHDMDSVTAMLTKGYSPLDMVNEILKGFEVEVLDEMEVGYRCGCTRESLENVIIGLPEDEIRELPDETGVASATCHFCNKKYIFTQEDLENLIKKKI